eukprot:2124953-Rhodomonas_salina.1
MPACSHFPKNHLFLKCVLVAHLLGAEDATPARLLRISGLHYQRVPYQSAVPECLWMSVPAALAALSF